MEIMHIIICHVFWKARSGNFCIARWSEFHKVKTVADKFDGKRLSHSKFTRRRECAIPKLNSLSKNVYFPLYYASWECEKWNTHGVKTKRMGAIKVKLGGTLMEVSQSIPDLSVYNHYKLQIV